jgi:predicted restriction endonuclease
VTLRNFNDPLYKKWRKKVYERDSFTCQWPGCKVKNKLNAHHIKKWSDYPALRFEISNGITLCKNHHLMIKGIEEIYEGTFYRIVAQKNGRL